MRLIIKCFIVLFIFSCNTKKQNNIIGVWETQGIKDGTGLNVSDRVEFKSDGKYKLTILSNNDSILSYIEGEFQLINDNVLRIKTNGREVENKIIEFDNSNIIIENKFGESYTLKRIE